MTDDKIYGGPGSTGRNCTQRIKSFFCSWRRVEEAEDDSAQSPRDSTQLYVVKVLQDESDGSSAGEHSAIIGASGGSQGATASQHRAINAKLNKIMARLEMQDHRFQATEAAEKQQEDEAAAKQKQQEEEE